jgi:hypothetical protein
VGREAGREGGNESKGHAPVGIYTPPQARIWFFTRGRVRIEALVFRFES